jgi:hypothetical protein
MEVKLCPFLTLWFTKRPVSGSSCLTSKESIDLMAKRKHQFPLEIEHRSPNPYCHFISIFSLILKKIKEGLWYHHAVCVCDSPLINWRTPEPIFTKLGMYIMAPEPISMAYLINPSHQCVYMCISLSLLDNGLVKRYHGNEYTSNKFLGTSFSMQSCRITRK